jgi:hypothetical protein
MRSLPRRRAFGRASEAVVGVGACDAAGNLIVKTAPTTAAVRSHIALRGSSPAGRRR